MDKDLKTPYLDAINSGKIIIAPSANAEGSHRMARAMRKKSSGSYAHKRRTKKRQ